MYLFNLIFDKQEFAPDHPIWKPLDGGLKLQSSFEAANVRKACEYKNKLQNYIEENNLDDQFRIERNDGHYDYAIIDILAKDEDSLMELVDNAGLFDHLSNIWVPKLAAKGSFSRRI